MSPQVVEAHTFLAFSKVDTKVIYLGIYYQIAMEGRPYLFIRNLPDITVLRKHLGPWFAVMINAHTHQ